MSRTLVKGLVITFFVLSVIGCGIASNKIIKHVNSPDGKYTAYVFTRDAGATTGSSHQVSLVKKGKGLPNSSGNIFICDHSEFIDVQWMDSTNLLITYGEEDRIYKNESSFKGISITYRKIKNGDDQ